ncbi:hypothetical protein COCSUDRAFT_40785 [Coccomyxa subellipsoidea C-169]|uniref:Uncharacterized protein n=1 Tax=Coccomyxa subellipsoidea (strain C-169) TaxID=574566 RepID=I0Z4L8_COCSC|nr:hypothetical protein COCSUDRAFT_40785 [Coccomyxa subellipsoidea C-169]EIE25587.1 hypothetical protein COCSUDRAFT_40785 [Coccomyxa subellipsoidea C-169]|eukprot:XP_005650131.1 hypothetical protein COCSUDRAFT_40785 [Coccomyxa subellipsoidea C-169]
MSRVLVAATFFALAWLSGASPNVEKIASGLMDNYQKTLQDVLSTFTDTVNSAGALKAKANTDITSTAAEVVGSTESTIKAALDAANTVYAKITDSSMPVIGQVANGAKYIQQSAQDAVAQVKSLYGTYEDAYCTPAEYTPPAKVPANLTGPGFTLTFELGNCTFDGKELLSKDGAIHCVGPSVTLDRTPATFTSAYISAAKFVGQECEISKSFGETKTEVLYVFDPKELAKEKTPLSDIPHYLEQELSDVLSRIGISPLTAGPTTTPEAPLTPVVVAKPPETLIADALARAPQILRDVVVAKAPETPVAEAVAAASPAAGPVSVVAASPSTDVVSPAAGEVATVPASPATAVAAPPPGTEVITVPASSGSGSAPPPDVRVIRVPASGGR